VARAERLDPQLGAIVSRQFESARAEAASPTLPAGPLRGVPYLLKDLGAHLAGDPVYCGMGVLARAGWRETGESYFAGKLRAAGMISLGRTNSPELGILPTTEPDAFEPTRNPWQPGASAGGSSGGSAAAVAAGVVAAAHASDGGGSIRIPASHCGLVGLKPSRGRNSFGPGLGERWGGCSAEGFVTRSVRDTAVLLDITAGAMPGDPYTAPPPSRPYAREVGADPGRLRVGWMRRAPRDGEVHPECLAAAERAASLLASSPATSRAPSTPGAPSSAIRSARPTSSRSPGRWRRWGARARRRTTWPPWTARTPTDAGSPAGGRADSTSC
jgi:amidase